MAKKIVKVEDEPKKKNLDLSKLKDVIEDNQDTIMEVAEVLINKSKTSKKTTKKATSTKKGTTKKTTTKSSNDGLSKALDLASTLFKNK